MRRLRKRWSVGLKRFSKTRSEVVSGLVKQSKYRIPINTILSVKIASTFIIIITLKSPAYSSHPLSYHPRDHVPRHPNLPMISERLPSPIPSPIPLHPASTTTSSLKTQTCQTTTPVALFTPSPSRPQRLCPTNSSRHPATTRKPKPSVR